MISYSKNRLKTLYWETKTRISYCFFSFLFCFLISYKNSVSLLYLFVSSYEKGLAENLNYNDTPYSSFCAFLNEISKIIRQNTLNDKSVLLYEKFINTTMQQSDLSTVSDNDLIALLETFQCCGTSSIKFIFTDVEEAFSTTISICLIFSSFFCFLYIVYAAFSFLAPSMYCYEANKWFRRTSYLVGFWIVFIICLQKIIIPKLALFLLKFQIQSVGFNVEAETKIYSYCVWASTLFLIANLIFLFVFLAIFSIINGNIKIKFFIYHRKWCGVFLLLFSAFIAPPDLFVQLFLVLVLVFFFELLIYFFHIYKNTKQLRNKNYT